MKNNLSIITLVSILFLFLSSCSSDDSMTEMNNDSNQIIDESGLSDYQKNVISYFKEVALGFEFGTASKITRKWKIPMKIFVDGAVTTELDTELKNIISEINDLVTDGFTIEIVDTRDQSNYHIFLGSASQYASLYPDIGDLTLSNWGLFSVYWNEFDQLTDGHMYVDIERANEAEEKHLLREELTQSLGLARDSQKFPESIFQSAWTRTTNYAQIDQDLIKILYHPDMITGLNSAMVNPILIDILKEQ